MVNCDSPEEKKTQIDVPTNEGDRVFGRVVRKCFKKHFFLMAKK